MKKVCKKILVSLCVVCVILGMSAIVCQAAGSSTMSCDTSLKTGDSVTVTVRISAGAEDNEIWGIEGNLSYNSAVLSYVGCSETGNLSGSSIKFAAVGNGSASKSVTFSFTAVAAGDSYTRLNDCTYSGAVNNSLYEVAGCGVTIKVSAPQTSSVTPSSSETPTTSSEVSSNANLASLKVSGATLSPSFSANRTSYTATVENSIDKCTITASAADSAAKVTGTGTYDLNTGENTRTVTVTAASGAKKKYTVKIKRLAEGETIDSTSSDQNTSSDEAPLENDSLSVSLSGREYKVVKDISTLYIPVGYTIATAEYNGEQINILTENIGGRKLYYLTDINGAAAQLYCLSEADEFEKITYIETNGKLYIFEKPDGKYTAPEGFSDTVLKTESGDVAAYSPSDGRLNGFYYVYCYSQGTRGYYCYDSVENTLQRAPAFKPIEVLEVDTKSDSEMTVLERFNAITVYGKIVVLLGIALVVLLLVIVVLLIIRFTIRRKSVKPPTLAQENTPVFDETNVYSGFDFSYEDELLEPREDKEE